jgi:[CysO sulfur-carrier protein]-S-L-cysteine hydrolase
MKIERAREVEPRLRKALAKAGRREIGGMLMGEQVATDHFRIVDFSVDAFSGSRMHFRRDPDVHRKTLDEFFDRTDHDYQRFNYLGEWHSHPSFSVYPSVEDIETMTDIVENRSSTNTFAALLIVRLRWRLWIDYSLTLFARGHAPHGLEFSRRVVWL